MLKTIIRFVFKKYGYTFLKTEYLSDSKDCEYVSLSIVTEDDLQKKILFTYLSDEIARVHILSEKNVTHAIRSFEAILKQLNEPTGNSHPDSSAAQ